MTYSGAQGAARTSSVPTDASTSRPGTPTAHAVGSTQLADAQDSEPVAACAILLPRKFNVNEGTPLWGDVKLGRLLGAGVQAKVFELVHDDGRPTGKVLKISHTDLGHKILNNPVIWIGMEREWEIGTQLRAALEEPGGKLPGFMRMCDCLVRGGGDPESGKAQFNGMVMEKLNGWEVYKRIDTPEFHNIHYVREMLFQVFSALDRAQRKLGFHHADLGMRNVMEHYPRLWEEVEGAQQAKNVAAGAGVHSGTQAHGLSIEYEDSPGALPGEHQRQATGKPAAAVQMQTVKPAAAQGTAAAAGSAKGGGVGVGDRCFPSQPQRVAVERVSCAADEEATEAVGGIQGIEQQHKEQHEEQQQQPWWRQSATGGSGACGMVRPRRGFSCNADGGKLPLGPTVEFKIIDFGVAVFDQRLAHTAGGYESEGIMQRLNNIFAAKNITFETGQKASIEMETSEGATPGAPQKTWHLMPTSIMNRFRVKQTPPGATPITTAASLEAYGLPQDVDTRADALAGTAAVAEAAAGVSGGPEGAAAGVAAQPASPAAAAAGGAAAEGFEAPQRLRSATLLLREPGSGMVRAGEEMRASGAAAAAAVGGSSPTEGGMEVEHNPQHSASKPSTFKQGPIERMYRRFWNRKGDVFHLLIGMALALDDRVWPKEDERDVNLFILLVHHVTGVKMRASFAYAGEGATGSLCGRLACGSAPRVDGETDPLREYGRWGKSLHWFRRMHIRLQAHLSPFNSGLLAGEALSAPFFGAGRVQHAKLPVCVEQAFPRST